MHDRDVKWSKIAILKEIADRALFHGEGRAYREDPRFAVLVPPKLPSGDRARRLLVFLDADAAVSNFERTFEWQALHRESKNPGGGWAGAETVSGRKYGWSGATSWQLVRVHVWGAE